MCFSMLRQRRPYLSSAIRSGFGSGGLPTTEKPRSTLRCSQPCGTSVLHFLMMSSSDAVT
uniref:Uncharacterized protein n=1 Tax=uncultured marine virus TaxID=186617 RepID=A0A0F7L3B5_9VIRU|nr:hypothetical protein [uncultured marine virus]